MKHEDALFRNTIEEDIKKEARTRWLNKRESEQIIGGADKPLLKYTTHPRGSW